MSETQAATTPAVPTPPPVVPEEVLSLPVKKIGGEEPKIKTPLSKIAQEILGASEENEVSKDKTIEKEKINGLQSQEGKKDGEEVKPEAKEGEKSSEAQAIRKLKAKLKDKGELEIPEDAEITVKVNGKDETVSIRDLERNFQGKVPWEKHFKELKEQQKTFDSKRSKFDSDVKAADERIAKILSTAATDPYAALEELMIAAGKNPSAFLPAYVQQAEATIKHLSSLSETEKKALFQNKQLEYEKKMAEAKTKVLEDKEKKAAAEREIDAYVNAKQKENNLTEEDFVKAFKFFQEMEEDPKLEFSLKGKSGQEITDMIVDYLVQVDRPMARIKELSAKVDPKLAADTKFIYETHKLISTDMSDADILEVIRGFVGTPAEEPKKEELVQVKDRKESNKESPTKATSPKIPPKKTEMRTEADDDDILSIDDLVKSYKRR